MPAKKVSIVLCTYNGENYLREQLDSIINQTHPIFEILVQDDGSTDNTMAILKEYAARYPVIQVKRNPTNLGHKMNFKTGFYRASGDYIAIADQDDIWVDTKIEQLIEGIGDNYLVYSSSYLFIEKETLEHVPDTAPFRHPFMFATLQDMVYGHTALFKRELLDYIPDEVWTHYPYDYTLCLAAMGLNKITGVNKYLTYWRRHPSASSGMPETQGSRWAGYVEGIKYYRKKEVRNKIRYFYQSVLPLFKEESVYKDFVTLMAQRKPLRLLQACNITYKLRHLLVAGIHPDSLTGRLRACWVPFFIHKNWKYIHANLSDL